VFAYGYVRQFQLIIEKQEDMDKMYEIYYSWGVAGIRWV
jgi:hypothetical protein